MRYERVDLGFSFELPNGWWEDKDNLTISFHGPNGKLGVRTEIVQLFIGPILPQYRERKNREKFLSEPGAKVFKTMVGDERNAVVLQRSSHTEISVVRDGVHYSFSHANDSATEEAVAHIKKTTRFGSAEQAAWAIKMWADPKMRAMTRLLKASSPEEARLILAEAGMPAVVERPGYSLHVRETAGATKKLLKRWWQFWK